MVDHTAIATLVTSPPPRAPALVHAMARKALGVYRAMFVIAVCLGLLPALMTFLSPGTTRDRLGSFVTCALLGSVALVLPAWLILRAGRRRFETILGEGQLVYARGAQDGGATLGFGATTMRVLTIAFADPSGRHWTADVTVSGTATPGGGEGVPVFVHPAWPRNVLVCTGVAGQEIVEANAKSVG